MYLVLSRGRWLAIRKCTLLRRFALRAFVLMSFPLLTIFVNGIAFAQTPIKCINATGQVVYQDTPCVETLQKQAEDAQKKRQQAKQLQAERDKKWEARDVERMKTPNPYGALVTSNEKVLQVAAECGAIVGRASSCRLDTHGAGVRCGDRIKFYANFDKVKEKEGFDQFALTATLGTALQGKEPISCNEVKRQLADLLR
jgi:hypothetical protein